MAFMQQHLFVVDTKVVQGEAYMVLLPEKCPTCQVNSIHLCEQQIALTNEKMRLERMAEQCRNTNMRHLLALRRAEERLEQKEAGLHGRLKTLVEFSNSMKG